MELLYVFDPEIFRTENGVVCPNDIIFDKSVLDNNTADDCLSKMSPHVVLGIIQVSDDGHDTSSLVFALFVNEKSSLRNIHLNVYRKDGDTVSRTQSPIFSLMVTDMLIFKMASVEELASNEKFNKVVATLCSYLNIEDPIDDENITFLHELGNEFVTHLESKSAEAARTIH